MEAGECRRFGRGAETGAAMQERSEELQGSAGCEFESAFMAALPMSQTTIDYDVDRRGEEGLVDRLLQDDSARVVLVNNGLVAVPKRSSAAAPGALDCKDDPAAPRPDAEAPGGDVKLALLSAAEVRADACRPGCLVIYLGLDRTVQPAVPYLALDITRMSGAPRNSAEEADHEQGRSAVTFAQRALRDFDWVELRSLAPCASVRDAGLATSAVAVSTWHSQQRFCPACGHPVAPTLSGWAQTCTNPDDAGRLLFPRIEPAVITAIVDDADRILLQHNTAWRENFYSVSAGFVEAGESLEHAVRREAHEEVGAQIGEVRYLGSQSWPFPASIMLGFRAHATSTEVHVDHEEVASARWFTRAELAEAVAAGFVVLPGRASIARHLIEDWYGARF